MNKSKQKKEVESLEVPDNTAPVMITGAVLSGKFKVIERDKGKDKISVCSGFSPCLEMTGIRSSHNQLVVSVNTVGKDSGGDLLALLNRKCRLD